MPEAKPKKISNKKALLFILPIVIIPLVIGGLYIFKGDKNQPLQSTGSILNTSLPAANFKDNTDEDKLSLYENALKDSLRKEMDQNTRLYSSNETEDSESISPLGAVENPFQPNATPGQPAKTKPSIRTTEQKVKAKLEEIQTTISTAENEKTPDIPIATLRPNDSLIEPANADLANIEKMINDASSAHDPELDKMDEMLNKILDIQHPNATAERLKLQSQKNKKEIIPIKSSYPSIELDYLPSAKRTLDGDDSIQILKPIQISSSATFFDDEQAEGILQAGSVEAVIHQTQELVTGNTIKMRLKQSIILAGIDIPAGTFLYGKCNINGERLMISVSSIRHDQSILPVDLDVYSYDGIAGIPIPGTITRTTAKDGIAQATQSMDLFSMDPSISAQAAAVGMNTVKSLVSKKAKLVKVTMPADYPVLLKDNSQKM